MTEDLSKLLEMPLDVGKGEASWQKGEQERLASQQNKMKNIFGDSTITAPPAPIKNNNSNAIGVGAVMSAMAREKHERDQRVRNKVSLEEKKRLMKARRTMGREEYNKLAKDYTEKSNQRQQDQNGGVYVGDPAGDTGAFQTLLAQLQHGVSTGRMSTEQGDSLSKALNKADSMIGRMSKTQQAMFQSMMSDQGLSSFVNMPKQRLVTELDLTSAPPEAKNNKNNNKKEEEEEGDSERTARQKKNRKKREKYREKKRKEAQSQKEQQQTKCLTSST